MKSRIHLINRGEIFLSSGDLLKTVISTCVSLCIYHPILRTGGMTHISSSRYEDSSPSKRYIKSGGFYYADTAIPGILDLFREKHGSLREKSLEAAVIGGMEDEGPIREVREELERYRFKIVGTDINQSLHRQVIFDTSRGVCIIYRNRPFDAVKDIVEIEFSRPAYLTAMNP